MDQDGRPPEEDHEEIVRSLRAEIARLREENGRLREELRRARRDQYESPPHFR